MKRALAYSCASFLLFCLPLAGCDDGGKSQANNTNLCGNDRIDPGEPCDGTDLGGLDCEGLLQGFTGGTLRCSAACQFDTSACSATCTNECTQGASRCDTGGTGIETCALGASGCTEWQTQACPQATPVCRLDGGLPVCAVDCSGACTVGASRCTEGFDGIESCVAGANGCGEWQAADCAPETPDCVIQGGGAVCVNNCVDECTADAVRCNPEASGVETCVTGVTGCTAWENAPCGVDTPLCELRTGVPTCVVDCGPPPCTIGQTSCDTAGGAIVTCEADGDGCARVVNTTCDVATPFCEIVGGAPVCLENCLDDCVLDAVRCNAGADGIETCVTGANGCAEWSNTACATATPDCLLVEGTPTCLYTNGSGESCSDVYRIRFPFYTEGDDFTADFATTDMNFTHSTCTTGIFLGSGPEAVFSHEMLAGEAVVFIQGLGVDGQLLIQANCDAAGACLDTVDDGLDDEVEYIIFTAPSDGTYYFIVKSYYTSPSPATYGIAIYAYETPAELTCDDGFDNDGDGLWDCEDSDCAGIEPCGDENTEARCGDGFDNDNDGFVDCADTGCAGVDPCGAEDTEARCADGVDNDNDGSTDCGDPDCGGLAGCVPEADETTCADGVDNDGDGAVDCDDSGCHGVGTCPNYLLVQRFETWPPAGWTISDGGTAGYSWQSSATSTAGLTLTGGTGRFAIVDSDEAGTGVLFDDSLVTPVLDCSAYTTVTLGFRHHYNDYSTYDSAAVEVSTDGATWTPVVTYTTDVTNSTVANLDLSAQAAGQATVRIRFRYIGNYDFYWLIDDVIVTAN